MSQQLPDPCQKLLKRQSGMIASWQAQTVGLSQRRVNALVRNGRWQRVYLGVYASFTGEPPREAQLWAAVLRTGPRSMLSHETVAALSGLIPQPHRVIHITIPHDRHFPRIAGLAIHRSSRFDQVIDPGRRPPRAHIDECILDLVQAANSFDEVVSLLARSCQRQVTTPFLLRKRLEQRPRMRWRKEILLALQGVDTGAHSPLEFRYLRDVERAHGLPASQRQAPARHQGQRIFRDLRYRKYHLVVELDGKASHPDEQRWQDRRRDNAAAAAGDVTLRYGWADVTERACETASEVGAVLHLNGWKGTAHRCGPACRLKRS